MTGIIDAVERITSLEGKWTGHVAWMTDDRWPKQILEWQTRGIKMRRTPSNTNGPMTLSGSAEIWFGMHKTEKTIEIKGSNGREELVNAMITRDPIEFVISNYMPHNTLLIYVVSPEGALQVVAPTTIKTEKNYNKYRSTSFGAP